DHRSGARGRGALHRPLLDRRRPRGAAPRPALAVCPRPPRPQPGSARHRRRDRLPGAAGGRPACAARRPGRAHPLRPGPVRRRSVARRRAPGGARDLAGGRQPRLAFRGPARHAGLRSKHPVRPLRSRPVMSIARCAALSLALLAAAGCGPDDGVLRVSFGLFPSENLDLPPAEQLGVELEAVDLAGAEGRCAADAEARAMRCELAGLPAVSTSLSSPHYRLVLHFDDEPIPPPTTSPPLALSLTSEVEDLGRIAPDPLGTVRVTLADTD